LKKLDEFLLLGPPVAVSLPTRKRELLVAELIEQGSSVAICGGLAAGTGTPPASPRPEGPLMLLVVTARLNASFF
jgi:hypothetical protein